MLCVENVQYSVKLNHKLIEPIILGRGLKQGDPLSPYLFLICVEGLSALIKSAQQEGKVHGISICHGALNIAHSLFFDDCYLFCRATSNEAMELKKMLVMYELASGQAINLSKSEVFFSRNFDEARCAMISNILGVHTRTGAGKYLAMSSIIDRNRRTTFSFVKSKLWKKIHSVR